MDTEEGRTGRQYSSEGAQNLFVDSRMFKLSGDAKDSSGENSR